VTTATSSRRSSESRPAMKGIISQTHKEDR
jgi:hypothetical protein